MMKRRNFLKWCGIAPGLGVLGIKIPWPKPDVLTVEMVNEAIRKAEAEETTFPIGNPLTFYDDTIVLSQRRSKAIDCRKNNFDPKNYGVIAVKTCKS
uniref:Twin-arginine translocation signal domain-containing protein n=1 Tax=viral metagenome TaxID=1070528 RepID=A0A6M3KZ21_9ZZZZ